MTAGCQPQWRGGGHPALDIEAVRATVEGHPWLMEAGLRGQQVDRPSGNVGCVDDQNVDATPQRRGQRLVEVAFVDLTGRGDVTAGAPHRGRVDVDCVQLDPGGGPGGRGQCGADRARAATQVNDNGTWPGQGGGLVDEELGAAARDEDTGVHGDPQAAELRPAEEVFEGHAGGSPIHHGGDVVRGAGCADEQPRFVLGEDTAGRPKPGDDDGSKI